MQLIPRECWWRAEAPVLPFRHFLPIERPYGAQVIIFIGIGRLDRESLFRTNVDRQCPCRGSRDRNSRRTVDILYSNPPCPLDHMLFLVGHPNGYFLGFGSSFLKLRLIGPMWPSCPLLTIQEPDILEG